MKLRALFAALAVAALLAVPASAQRARRPAPTATDWTLTVVRTPEGGFRMGNPGAPIKVIEYLSLTCPHCAAFAHEGSAALMQRYVRPGRVSIEYRNYVLNGYDLAASFLTRCASPRQYFEMSHELLATQPRWMGRIQTLTDAQRSELRGLPPLQAMPRIVALLGLDAIGARHGLTAAAQRACLASQAGLDQIGTMQQVAERDFGVAGTPTFLINGRSVGSQDWARLEPMLTGR